MTTERLSWLRTSPVFVLVIILIVNYTVEDMINTFISITSLSFFRTSVNYVAILFFFVCLFPCCCCLYLALRVPVVLQHESMFNTLFQAQSQDCKD